MGKPPWVLCVGLFNPVEELFQSSEMQQPRREKGKKFATARPENDLMHRVIKGAGKRSSLPGLVSLCLANPERKP